MPSGPWRLGGVMGGAETRSIAGHEGRADRVGPVRPFRSAPRPASSKLHSPSSYRFERGTDPEGVDWASRRCCELILELAGGELVEGVIDVGAQPKSRDADHAAALAAEADYRHQGSEPRECGESSRLSAVGKHQRIRRQITTIPPSWRRDLTREIDLIEEVARIHGYDKIPEDANVPMAASQRTDADRVLAERRQVLTAAGFDEAMTAAWSAKNGPPRSAPGPTPRRWSPIRRWSKGKTASAAAWSRACSMSRRTNESVGNVRRSNCSRSAKVYLPQCRRAAQSSNGRSPPSAAQGFLHLKGVVETLLCALHIRSCHSKLADFRQRRCWRRIRPAELKLGGQATGLFWAMSQPPASKPSAFAVQPRPSSKSTCRLLAAAAVLIPQHRRSKPVSRPSARDLNLIVAEKSAGRSWPSSGAAGRNPRRCRVSRHLPRYRKKTAPTRNGSSSPSPSAPRPHPDQPRSRPDPRRRRRRLCGEVWSEVIGVANVASA